MQPFNTQLRMLMKAVSMGKSALLDLQVSLVRKCKEFKIRLWQPAALRFLTCKAQAMGLYGFDMRRKMSKQNSPLETLQGQWFPSLLGWSPGSPATRRDSCQRLESTELFLLSLNVSAYLLLWFFSS